MIHRSIIHIIYENVYNKNLYSAENVILFNSTDFIRENPEKSATSRQCQVGKFIHLNNTSCSHSFTNILKCTPHEDAAVHSECSGRNVSSMQI